MLERISQAQLSSALTARDESLQKSLCEKDSLILLATLNSLVLRYPSQDMEPNISEFQADYEKLALKYSLPKILEAVETLRLDPAQKFFPRPDEVAERIEQQRESSRLPSVAETKAMLDREDAERERIINDPAEKAWRIEHFGYDPYTEREPNEAA